MDIQPSKPLRLEDHGHEMVLPARASTAKSSVTSRTERCLDAVAMVVVLLLFMTISLLLALYLRDPWSTEALLQAMRERMDAALIAWVRS